VAIGTHSGLPKAKSVAMWTNVTASIAAYRAMAPRNLPKMIWKSVSGAVSSSSIVPERFSSA
jgi:hypothetical protein